MVNLAAENTNQTARRFGALLLCLFGLLLQSDATCNASQDGGGVAAEEQEAGAADELIPYVSEGRGRRGIWIQRDIVVSRTDDYELKVDLYRGDDTQVRPVVLLIHGGAWAVGDKWDLEPLGRSLVKAGLHAVSTNYRLAPKHKFPAQLIDCQRSLRWLRHNAKALHVDANSIGVWGYSAGAQLAALTSQADILAKQEAGNADGFGNADASADHTAAAIKACVCGGLPSTLDYVGKDSNVFVYVIGATRAAAPELYSAAAPLEQLGRSMCPTFLYHGTKDKIVPYDLGKQMQDRLTALDVRSQLRTIDGKGHIGAFLDGKTRQMVIEFLQEHLVTPEKVTDAIP